MFLETAKRATLGVLAIAILITSSAEAATDTLKRSKFQGTSFKSLPQVAASGFFAGKGHGFSINFDRDVISLANLDGSEGEAIVRLSPHDGSELTTKFGQRIRFKSAEGEPRIVFHHIAAATDALYFIVGPRADWDYFGRLKSSSESTYLLRLDLKAGKLAEIDSWEGPGDARDLSIDKNTLYVLLEDPASVVAFDLTATDPAAETVWEQPYLEFDYGPCDMRAYGNVAVIQMSYFCQSHSGAKERNPHTYLTAIDLKSGQELARVPVGRETEIYGIDSFEMLNERFALLDTSYTFMAWDLKNGGELIDLTNGVAPFRYLLDRETNELYIADTYAVRGEGSVNKAKLIVPAK